MVLGLLLLFLKSEIAVIVMAVSLMGVLLLLLTPRMQKKRLQSANDHLTEEYTVFYTEYMETRDTYFCTNYAYAGICEVVETERFWFLLYGTAAMQMLDKRGMLTGTAEELSQFLYRVCGENYTRLP